jgi:hypothetical protein
MEMAKRLGTVLREYVESETTNPASAEPVEPALNALLAQGYTSLSHLTTSDGTVSHACGYKTITTDLGNKMVVVRNFRRVRADDGRLLENDGQIGLNANDLAAMMVALTK